MMRSAALAVLILWTLVGTVGDVRRSSEGGETAVAILFNGLIIGCAIYLWSGGAS